MSASGMLDANNVVFYHPLNSDRKEVLLDQVWSGSAGFADGVIEQAMVGSSGCRAAYGPESVFPDTLSTNTKSRNKIARISDTKVFVTFASTNNVAGFGVVGEVSGSTMRWGNKKVLTVGGLSKLFLSPAVMSGGQQAVVTWYSLESAEGLARIVTFSGDLDFTLSSDVFAFHTGGGEDMSDCTDLGDTNRFAAVWKIGLGPPTFSAGQSRIGTISGSGENATIAYGGVSNYITSFARNSTIKRISDTQVVVAFTKLINTSEPESLFCNAATFDGDTLVWQGGAGTLVAEDVGSFSDEFIIAPLPTTFTFDIHFSITNKDRNNDKLTTRVGSLDTPTSTLIRMGGLKTIFSSINSTASFGVTPLSTDRYMIAYRDNSDIGQGKGKVICANFIQSFVSPSLDDVELEDGSTQYNDDTVLPWIEQLKNNQILLCHKNFIIDDGLGHIVFKDTSGSLLTSISGYQDPINESRIVVCAWAKNLTGGGIFNISPMNIFVDQENNNTVHFTSGITESRWSGVVMPPNDDIAAFIVMQFENNSSVELKVSISGEPYIDYGPADLEVFILDVDNKPGIVLSESLDAEKFIDELAMWAGDAVIFDEFTSIELNNLYNLATICDVPLNQYTSCFPDSALELANAMDLVIGEVPPQSISGSLDEFLFLKVPEPIVDGLVLFLKGFAPPTPGPIADQRFIDKFILTGDFIPQLIGQFTQTNPSGVIIEVWDTINGANEQLILLSDVVEQIGNTQSWRWSMADMPTDRNLSGRFLFRMLADTGEEVEKEVIVESVENQGSKRIRRK